MSSPPPLAGSSGSLHPLHMPHYMLHQHDPGSVVQATLAWHPSPMQQCAGGNGPMHESTFTPDSEAWTAKNARIIALRKEKSRDAARSRRGKENYEYYELAKMLPLPAAITSQLDKASIIRLTMSYLKIRDFALQGDPPWHNYLEGHGVGRSISSVLQGRFLHQPSSVSAMAQEVYEHNLGGHLLQALDGFLFALCSDGRFLYISETVSIYLGLSQVEMTGSSIFDYVHVGDHAELADQLGMKLPPSSHTISRSSSVGTGSSDGGPVSPVSSPTSPYSESHNTLNMTSTEADYNRSLVIRMKSTLTKRGVHIKSSGYKVIHITGSMRSRMVLAQYSRSTPTVMGFIAVAQSLPPPTVNEIHLEPSMFVCKLDLDLTIVFCEAKIQEFIDLSAEDVTGKSLYSFLHVQDISNFRNCHNDLLNKGQMMTHYYRWMCKTGGYIWMQSTATLSYARTSNDRTFMFINQVISKVELEDTVMDISQCSTLPADVKPESSDVSGSGEELGHDVGNNSADESKVILPKVERISPKYLKKSSQEATSGRGKSPSRTRKRKVASYTDQRDSKKNRQSRQEDTGKAANDLSETVIVDQNLVEAKKEGAKPAESHQLENNVRKPKKVSEDHQLRQSVENQIADTPTAEGSMSTVAAVPLDTGYISPIDHSVHSNGRDSDSFSNSSQGNAVSHANEGWDNPPNKEVSCDQEARPQRFHEVCASSRQVVGEDNIAVPSKGSYSSGRSPSSPPASVLTPPLSDSCQPQFVLPPVSSLSDTTTKHYSPETISNMLIGHNNNNNLAAVSKGFQQPGATSPEVVELGRAITLTKVHPTSNTDIDLSDAPAATKSDHLYNTQPRVITSVSTAYAGMPYTSYGQYTNFQQFSNPVNIGSRHGYHQSNPYANPYKNFRTSHHDMPMDLSYNNMGNYSNMSLLHSNPTVGAPHAYYHHPAKISYNATTEAGLQILHDRSGLEDSTKAANTKL